MKKYNISKQFGMYAHINIPLVKWLLPIYNGFLKFLRLFVFSTKDVRVKRIKIKSFDNKKINTITFEPRNKDFKNCIIYYHGGGFILQSGSYHYQMAKELVKKTSSIVIFCDYRLAPKYPYPTGLNDCFEVYKYALNNYKNKKMIVMGDSAGGNLSIAVSMKARDEKIKIPDYELLIYPVCSTDMDTQSYKEFVTTPLWNSNKSIKMFKWYLNSEEHKYVNIIKSDLNNLPPTYIEVAEFDCLRDEGIQLYKLLNMNNVICELKRTYLTPHGYDIKSKSTIVKECMKRRIEIINSLK